MKRANLIAVLLLSGAAPTAHSMQPCRQSGGCIDEASATVLASLQAIVEACADHDPSQADNYQAGLARELQQEDPEFIGAVKRLPAFSEFLAEARSNTRKMSKSESSRECQSLFASEHVK